MRQTILLIGVSSPLGRAIADELITLGHRVVGSSRVPSEGFELLDVRNSAQARDALQRVRPTTVIYLAKPDLSPSNSVPQAIEAAVAALHQFTTIAAENGVERLIFASSAAVYGTDEQKPRRETDQVHALSPYADLKLRSEAALADAGNSSGLSTLALRIFNVYGSGFSNSLVNRLLQTDEGPPSIYDTEHFVRDYVHVRDVARAFGIGVGRSQYGSRVLNVGTGVGTSNRSLLQLCPNAAYIEHPNSDVLSFSVADTSLMRTLWDFDAQIHLADAVRNPYDFIR